MPLDDFGLMVIEHQDCPIKIAIETPRNRDTGLSIAEATLLRDALSGAIATAEHASRS